MWFIRQNIFGHVIYCYHWRRSALNSAGALQGRDGEFRGIFTPFYTINFRGGHKNGGACAPVAPPSLAPMYILKTYCTINITCLGPKLS